MTIKEMQKVYKKVDKLFNEYDAAKTDLFLASNSAFEFYTGAIADMTTCCKRVEKAGRAIMKMVTEVLNVSDLYNNPCKVLHDNADNDELFVRWCITAGVEFKGDPDAE